MPSRSVLYCAEGNPLLINYLIRDHDLLIYYFPWPTVTPTHRYCFDGPSLTAHGLRRNDFSVGGVSTLGLVQDRSVGVHGSRGKGRALLNQAKHTKLQFPHFPGQ